MPAGRGDLVRPPEPGEIVDLPAARDLGRLVGRNAHVDDVEIAANVEAKDAQVRDEALHRDAAEHRALVVDERQDHRTVAEVVAQRDRRSRLVDELQVERQRRAELLVDTDTLREVDRVEVLGRSRDRYGQADCDTQRPHHSVPSPVVRVGRPRAARISIARRTGILATPASRSIQV